MLNDKIKGIVIEGVECAGKTTLIKRIRDEIEGLDCKFLAHTPGPQFERFMYEYMINHGTIYNRAHYSERVYSELFGRETPFSENEIVVLDEFISRHFVVVLCDADLETLKKRYAERKYYQKANEADLEKIQALFKNQFRNVPHIKYNSVDHSALEATLQEIKGELGKPV